MCNARAPSPVAKPAAASLCSVLSQTDRNHPETTSHDPYGALREPNYRRFAVGWILASTGLQMQAAAVLWEIYELTRSPLLVGVAGLARALPVIALALPAGALIDLLDRRRVLIATQFGFAAAGLLLAAVSASGLGVGWLLGVLFLTGCARTFNGPARSSLLPTIVSPARFHNAVTWNTGMFHLSAATGPALAGVVIAQAGGAWLVYALAAAACLVFGVLAVHIRPSESPGTPAAKSLWQAVRPSTLMPGMLEGAKHIGRERTVLAAILLDLLAVLFGGVTALLPIFAKDVLDVGPVGFGVLRSAQAVGALGIAVALAHRPPFRRAGPALIWSVVGFGVCTVVFGLSPWFLVSALMLAALGALDGVSVVIRHVLVTIRTPDRLRGRVSAVNSVFIECSNEVGNFQSGVLAAVGAKGLGLGLAGGAVFSAVLGGIGTLAVVAVVASLFPELRRLGRLDPPAK